MKHHGIFKFLLFQRIQRTKLQCKPTTIWMQVVQNPQNLQCLELQVFVQDRKLKKGGNIIKGQWQPCLWISQIIFILQLYNSTTFAPRGGFFLIYIGHNPIKRTSTRKRIRNIIKLKPKFSHWTSMRFTTYYQGFGVKGWIEFASHKSYISKNKFTRRIYLFTQATWDHPFPSRNSTLTRLSPILTKFPNCP